MQISKSPIARPVQIIMGHPLSNLYLLYYIFIGRSQNRMVPVSFDGHNLPPALAEIELTDRSKSGVSRHPRGRQACIMVLVNVYIALWCFHHIDKKKLWTISSFFLLPVFTRNNRKYWCNNWHGKSHRTHWHLFKIKFIQVSIFFVFQTQSVYERQSQLLTWQNSIFLKGWSANFMNKYGLF